MTRFSLCPGSVRPNRETLSAVFGFRVPLPFVELVEWIFEQANGDSAACSKLFEDVVGIYPAGRTARYTWTPCELFPIGGTGVDGDHYGYLVHAPELNADDYPVCHYCPMDSDGVILVGRNTFEGLAATIQFWGNAERRPDSLEWKRAFAELPDKREFEVFAKSHVEVPDGWRFIPSSDGAGVMAPAEMFSPEPLLEIDPYLPVDPLLHAADFALQSGYFATALYYTREAYWNCCIPKSVSICERLRAIYECLGRPALAEIAKSRIDTWAKRL